MDENLALYAPDFPVENWTRQDRHFLEPFFTNLDGHVAVMRNVPPELAGALCSKASRSRGYLLRIFLNEYVYPILNGQDRKLSAQLANAVSILRDYGLQGLLSAAWGRKFYARWLAEYGDDSIAQMTGSYAIFWGISQVAMKFLEDQGIALEPIEKSTRFVNFGIKVNQRYLYYVPKPDLDRRGLTESYMNAMDGLFETYDALVPRLIEWLTKEHPDQKPMVIEKKAFDTLRGLLPMATLGQVAFRGNAQAFEYLINRTAQHELGELRWISAAVHEELDKEIPSLLLRVKEEKAKRYQKYLAQKRTNIRRIANEYEFSSIVTPVFEPSVELIEWDEDAEERVLTAILFSQTDASWNEIKERVGRLSRWERLHIFEEYLKDRTERWYKVGGAFENSYLLFEIVMDIGAYRDLHRHRMHAQDRQHFTWIHGYDIPEEVKLAGLEHDYAAALNSITPIYMQLFNEFGPEFAQYVVPLAYKVRFYQRQNFRAFVWETELRTISQGHPNYRKIEQMKFQIVKERFPWIAHLADSKLLHVDMNEYLFARRETEDKIQAKASKLLGS